jgi:ADP-ribose pyrophosphatase YjhB (NUDIX family)
MTYQRNSHCSFCGARFAEGQPWPRRCASCAQTSYLNPLPVAVLLLPVDGGLLLVRRSIPPQIGLLALPGGFIDIGESWQAAAARELYEEAAISIDPATISEFMVRSAPGGMVLIFGIAPPTSAAALPAFAPNSEASERLVLHSFTELAFPLHTEAAARYFAERGS